MKPPTTKKQFDALVRKQWREMTDAEFFAEIKAARDLKSAGQS